MPGLTKRGVNEVSFRLPDTLADWPWPRRLNPHYAEVKRASGAWLESFGAFSPKDQAVFNKCDFNLLSSLAYPDASKDHLRIACDLMNLFFVFDEYSDVEDEETVQGFADIIMDALRHPHKARPTAESLLGEITRQFWERAVLLTSHMPAAADRGPPAWQARFIRAFDTYCQSVVQQAAERATGKTHNLQTYWEMRRENIGFKPCMPLLCVDNPVPDEVLAHPSVVELETWVTDMLIMGNDICSYNVEQARGDDGHNIVTIVMHQFGVDLSGAMDWIEEYHQKLADQFLTSRSRLPSWGPEVDAQVRRYVDGLGNWVRGNDTWSFESQRYFGRAGLEIQLHREVSLLPRNRV